MFKNFVNYISLIHNTFKATCNASLLKQILYIYIFFNLLIFCTKCTSSNFRIFFFKQKEPVNFNLCFSNMLFIKNYLNVTPNLSFSNMKHLIKKFYSTLKFYSVVITCSFTFELSLEPVLPISKVISLLSFNEKSIFLRDKNPEFI